jgi:glycosyltransferase 2 family protein
MKQKILYLVKLLFGLALVLWILNQIDRKQFIEYFRHIGLAELTAVLILSAVSLVFQFQRWKYIVRGYSSQLDHKDLLPSFLAGFTLRLMIPGGHAEWSKAFLMSGRKRGKILAVGMEKVLQTVFKIIMIGLVIPFSFPRYRILGILIVVVTLIAYLVLPRLNLIRNLMEKQVNTHLLFLVTSLQSIGVFLASAGQYFILLNQDYALRFLDSLHATVYLWAAGIFPLSISGLGIREGLAVYFFRRIGISAADAVATSLFLFALNAILPALIGIFFLYKNRQHLKTLRQTFRSSKELLAELLKNSKEPS